MTKQIPDTMTIGYAFIFAYNDGRLGILTDDPQSGYLSFDYLNLDRVRPLEIEKSPKDAFSQKKAFLGMKTRYGHEKVNFASGTVVKVILESLQMTEEEVKAEELRARLRQHFTPEEIAALKTL